MATLRFDGKVAAITGGGRGLGRAYALALAERGAAVVVNDLGCDLSGEGVDPDVAGAVVEEIRSAGGEAVADVRDVTGSDEAEALVARAVEAFGGLDILVNNVGGSRMFRAPTLTERTYDDIDFTLAANLRSSLFVSLAAWAELSRRPGARIVNISSGSAFGMTTAPDYCAAKAGIVGLTNALALAGAPLGIKVNGLMPTAFTRASAANNRDARQRALRERFFDPALVAPVVVVLAHESCDITGQMFSSAAGVVTHVYLAETVGVAFDPPTPEAILAGLDRILDRDGALVPEAAYESPPRYAGMLGLEI